MYVAPETVFVSEKWLPDGYYLGRVEEELVARSAEIGLPHVIEIVDRPLNRDLSFYIEHLEEIQGIWSLLYDGVSQTTYVFFESLADATLARLLL